MKIVRTPTSAKGGVTKEVLETELAVLPPKQTDIDYFTNTILGNPDNASKNLVAEINCLVVGVVFYETLDNGNGTIGVFVDRDFRGYGVGSQLLESLVSQTANTLEVTIFARNKSRGLYKRFGFVEVGPEFTYTFNSGAFLPAQRLVLAR